MTRSPWNPYPLLLVGLMAVGSAFMWVGLPLGLIWIASMIADSPQATLGPYLLILVGLPLGMIAVGKGLSMLDNHYAQVTGTVDDSPFRAPWLKSMRAERQRKSRRSVLDVVMVISVLVCLTLMGLWFLLFAGSPLPSS